MKRKLIQLAAVGMIVPFAAMAQVGQAAGDDGSAESNCAIDLASQDELTFEDLPEGLDVVACGLVGEAVLVDSSSTSISVEIPPPGEGIEATTYAADEADEVEILVATLPNGDLSYAAAEEAVQAAPPAACDDFAWNLLGGGRMTPGETFYIKAPTFPGYLNEAATRSAIVDGIRAWPQQYNDCGFDDAVGATVDDGGWSGVASAVDAGGCRAQGNDSTSVFDFGVMPSSALGIACRHIIYTPAGNYSDGGDVRFNPAYSWTNSVGGGCANQIDVQSVAAHEAGHWWGMAHVSASAHPYLTMRGGGIASVTCKSMLRTLGKGDVLGMRNMY